MDSACSRHEESLIYTNPRGKRELRRLKRRCESNIKIKLREIGRKVMDWIKLARDMILL